MQFDEERGVKSGRQKYDKAATNVKEVRAVKKKLHVVLTLKMVFVRLKTCLMG